MATCIKSLRISGLSAVKEEKCMKFSSMIGMLALIIFLSLISAIPFIQGGTAEEKNSATQENIRLTELSPAAIDKIQAELNKRLLDSKTKPLFYKASIQADKLNLLVEREGWKALSLNEKADTLLQVAQIYKVVLKEFVGANVELNNIRPEIHFYERDSNKELAFWTEGSGIILD
jgi:hypothetical protein